MAGLGGAVIGVSRSGRVRKKSAKLMEMEADGDEPDSRRKSMSASGGNSGGNGGTIHISYIPQTPRDKCASYLNPKFKPASGAQGSSLANKQASSAPNLKTSRKKPGGGFVGPPKKRAKKQDASLFEPDKTDEDSSFLSPKEERVIAIKQMSPHFDTLSGSAYLMGEDLHFITGEAVNSNEENSDDSNDEDPDCPGALKVDVGEYDEPSVSINEESGLKIKFILSPKTGIKSSKSEKSKSGKSSSAKKKKSSRSRKTSGHGGGKQKGKRKSHTSVSDVSVLDVLTSGGILPDEDNDDEDSHMDDTLSDDMNDDLLGAAKLVIAEPKPPQNKSKKKKKKKSSVKESLGIGVSEQPKRGSGKKARAKTSKMMEEKELIDEDSTVAELAPVLPQSLYFKEKNSTKKRINKKSIAKPKEKTEKKTRPISAYMLWSQDYRKQIVQENPEFDFAQISRRLGEIWQSYSDIEKMQWRSKAKIQSGKLASNLINTSKKPLTETVERIRPPALKPIAHPVKAEEIAMPLSPRDVNKVVGTSPLDVAAHLKLLGESLGTIGQRLTQHEGQIAVSGSLSVLLDSLLCSLGPLLCLTTEVEQLNGCSKETHQKILDNIAYIIPGL